MTLQGLLHTPKWIRLVCCACLWDLQMNFLYIYVCTNSWIIFKCSFSFITTKSLNRNWKPCENLQFIRENVCMKIFCFKKTMWPVECLTIKKSLEFNWKKNVINVRYEIIWTNFTSLESREAGEYWFRLIAAYLLIGQLYVLYFYIFLFLMSSEFR